MQPTDATADLWRYPNGGFWDRYVASLRAKQVKPTAIRTYPAGKPCEHRAPDRIRKAPGHRRTKTAGQGKSLQTVMDEIGARAAARGLTLEILLSSAPS